MIKKFLFVILAVFTAKAYTQNTENNVLLIIADDLGVDAMNGYVPEALIKANTPIIDSLRNSGLTFTNAWSHPTCSPTRSSIITGKHGFRTGVLNPDVDGEIDLSEHILHQHLSQESEGGIASSIIGKWHLGGNANSDIPLQMGVPYYAGLMTGGVANYYNWNLTINGSADLTQNYATTELTDLAIDWINEQDTPWFCWLAYNTPHTPFHLPPAELISDDSLVDDETEIDANPLPYFMAMIESLDTEIGRLLNGIPEEELANTTIIFMGDNGTSGVVVQDPFPNNHAKGSLYQGGINVPFIVSGNQVSRQGEIDSSLVATEDLFCTVTELFGYELNQYEDSYSFNSLFSQGDTGQRDCAFTDAKDASRGYGFAARDYRYKYINWDSVPERFFDLWEDPYETTSLLNGMGNLSAEEQLSFNKLSNLRETLSIYSIEESSSNLIVYPNPTSDSFSIGGLGLSQSVSVYNSNGKLLFTTQDLNNIDMSPYSRGVYLIRCGDYSKRIVIN